MKIINWFAYLFYHAVYDLSLKEFYELAKKETEK